jgi:hypothetical protein
MFAANSMPVPAHVGNSETLEQNRYSSRSLFDLETELQLLGKE